MKNGSEKPVEKKGPSLDEIKEKIHVAVELLIKFCMKGEVGDNFFSTEKKLQSQICELGCLFFQLYLVNFQSRLDYVKWMDT